MSFTRHGRSLSPEPSPGDATACPAAGGDRVDDAPLARLAKLDRVDPPAACPAPADASHGQPRLRRRFVIRGPSIVSMPASQHVDRYTAEVRERLQRLRPQLHDWLGELRAELDSLQIHEIHIQGHVKGSRGVSGQVADMAKDYLVRLGYEAVRIRVAGMDDGRSTFGVTVCVYGASRSTRQGREGAPAKAVRK